MSRTIFCTFLQREAEGQDFQLYPGDLGKRIYNEISKEAWAQWQHKQTMLINEKKLNMMNVEHRKLLEQEMSNGAITASARNFFIIPGVRVVFVICKDQIKSSAGSAQRHPATVLKTLVYSLQYARLCLQTGS